MKPSMSLFRYGAAAMLLTLASIASPVTAADRLGLAASAESADYLQPGT